MKITENFHLAEFDQRARHSLPESPYPNEWIEERLRPLCLQLEKLRAYFGLPITIISGYRSPAYNLKIGGASHSQHMQGRAADIVIPGISAAKVHSMSLRLHAAGELVIGGLGEYDGFTHIDIRETDRLIRWRGSRTRSETEG